MFKISNLSVEANGKKILKALNFEVNKGEVHAIMGPNGSGKSTLSKVIAGSPEYKILEGTIEMESSLESKDVLKMAPHERAREGIFVAFQYPTEIPGINNLSFLKTVFDVICKSKNVATIGIVEFKKLVEEKIKMLDMPETFLNREVNVDFSGGEKKRNEILQMAVLNPKIAFLDETDSGLDVDSLKIVAGGIKKLSTKRNSTVLITHYERILEYIQPNFVHILYNGQIIKTGGQELAGRVEKEGYEKIIEEFEKTKEARK